jgi:ABC-2 type transport system permease protein
MIRYLRLYAAFVRFSFSRALEFRLDFWFRTVMDAIYYAVNLAFFAVLYGHTESFGGMSLDQILVFTAGYLFSDGLYMTIFSSNTWQLAGLINRGDVDYYLVRPVSSLFFLSLREFAANSFVNLLMATGILVWALARYPGELAALEVAMYVVMLVLGCLVGAFFNLWFTIPTFWLHSGNGLRQVMMQLHPYMERPHQIFPGWLQRILLTALPLALVSSYPTWVLFSGVTVGKVAFFLAVLVATGAFTVLFWRMGVRNYASASS